MANEEQGHEAENQGEGNREAARQYNQAQKRFVESGKIGGAARDAADAVAGTEGEALRDAAEEGKRRSHGEDPAVSR